MNKKALTFTLATLLTAAPTIANACEYVKGEYADYLKCALGEQNVEVVSFKTSSETLVDCVYHLQGFTLPPKLKAITMSFSDGSKEDETCGHIGSYCDAKKLDCDDARRAQ